MKLFLLLRNICYKKIKVYCLIIRDIGIGYVLFQNRRRRADNGYTTRRKANPVIPMPILWGNGSHLPESIPERADRPKHDAMA